MTTKDRLPWRTGAEKSGSRGVLSRKQISDLSATFGIGGGALLELSRKLSMALSEDLNLSQPELVQPKIARGAREARKAIDALEKAEKQIERARDHLAQLRFRNEWAHCGVPDPGDQHMAGFLEGSRAIAEFRHFLQVMAREQLVTFTDVPDKRRVKDLRRDIVTTTIFNFWDERGRTLTITTDPDSGERSGELVRFVNAVVACLTDPPCRLHGETIFLDLKAFKAHAARD